MNDNWKKADKLVTLVTSAINLIIRDQYEIRSENPLHIELGTEVGPGAATTTELIERTLREMFARLGELEIAAAFEALKKEPTRERLATFLDRFVGGPPGSLLALSELDGASWDEILTWIDSYIIHGPTLVREIGRLIVKEREGFSSPIGAEIKNQIDQKAPGFLSLYSARKYASEFRELFPRMVGRAEIIHFISTGRNVPDHVRRYLEEASRCYIYGHFLAPLLLCRSTIEAATKDRLKKRGFAADLDKLDSLEGILCLAKDKNVLDEANWKAADEIRKNANKAVHPDGLPDDQYCMRAFDTTRGILQYLYK